MHGMFQLFWLNNFMKHWLRLTFYYFMIKIYSMCVWYRHNVLEFDEVCVAVRDLNIYKQYIDYIY